MTTSDIKTRFENAINNFVNKVKSDPNILSVVLYGSLANDTVWEKSDMDVYVQVRDMKICMQSFCLEEEGLIINVNMQTEFDFKRMIERSIGGDWTFSMFSKARVVYAKDESFKKFMEDFQEMGEDDRALAFFRQSTWLIGTMEKIEKWLTVKDDPLYAQLWVLKAAEIYANMRLILDKKPPSREALLKVMAYDPAAITPIYEKPMQGKMSKEEVNNALEFYKNFLIDNLDLLKRPVVENMNGGESLTITTLTKRFGMWSHDIYHIFDFLEEMGVVARVTEIVKITPKSRCEHEEVAFIYFNDEE